MESDEVQSEWLWALEQKKVIIPVLYQTCNIPFRLKPIQYSDFISHDPDDVAAIGRVLAAMEKDKTAFLKLGENSNSQEPILSPTSQSFNHGVKSKYDINRFIEKLLYFIKDDWKRVELDVKNVAAIVTKKASILLENRLIILVLINENLIKNVNEINQISDNIYGNRKIFAWNDIPFFILLIIADDIEERPIFDEILKLKTLKKGFWDPHIFMVAIFDLSIGVLSSECSFLDKKLFLGKIEPLLMAVKFD